MLKDLPSVAFGNDHSEVPGDDHDDGCWKGWQATTHGEREGANQWLDLSMVSYLKGTRMSCFESPSTWLCCTAAVWLHQRLLPKASVLNCEWSALISETNVANDYESDSCLSKSSWWNYDVTWLFSLQKADSEQKPVSIVPRLSVENYCCSLSKARINM